MRPCKPQPAKIALATNATLAVPSNLQSGQSWKVEVTQDTLHEPELTQQLVAALREGEWPKAKKSLTLKYELAPPRTHMVEVVEQPRRKSKQKPAAAPARVTGVGGL